MSSTTIIIAAVFAALLVPAGTLWAQGPVAGIWTPTDPGGGDAYLAIGAGPDGRIVAGSELSGAYTSTDLGNTWTILGPFLDGSGQPRSGAITDTHISSVAFHPRNANVFYVGSTIGLFGTTNGGLTFTQAQGIPKTGHVRYVAFAPSNPAVRYAAVAAAWDALRSRVYRTTNGGGAWTLMANTGLSTNTCVQKLVVDPNNAATLYLVTGVDILIDNAAAALWKSTDGGNSWSRMSIGAGSIWDMTTDPTKSNVLYLTKGPPGASGASDGVYKSTNSGSTWTKVFNQGGRIFARRSPTIRLINAAGTFESTNAGSAWSQTGDSYSWDGGWPSFTYALDMNPVRSIGEDLSNLDAYYWVNSQFVYGSFDGGRSFRPLYTNPVSAGWRGTGLSNSEPMAVSMNASHIYAGFIDIGCWHSDDKGLSWETCNEPDFTGAWYGRGGQVDAVLADPARAHVAWASLGDNGVALIYKTTGGGALGTWSPAYTGLRASANSSAMSGLSLVRAGTSNPRTLFVVQNSEAGGVNRSELYRSTNDGASWSRVFSRPGAPFSNLIYPLRSTAVAKDGSHVYAGGDDGVWRSDNGGTTWAQVGGASLAHTWELAADPVNSNTIYAAVWAAGGGLYRSTNAGAAWTKVLTDDNLRGVAIHPTNPKIVMVGSSANFCCGADASNSTGVQYTIDITNLAANPWRSANEGLSWPFAANLVFDPSNPKWVIAGTPGTGFHFRLFPNF